jgi:serine/threonine protein phosphatase 1
MIDQPRYLTLWEHLSHRQPAPHHSGKTVFVGHTPQRTGEILDLGHVVCIDTACAIGGWLTAIDVDTREIWQADRDGTLRIR